MKKMRKIFLAVMLAAVMFVSAGCSKGKDQNEQGLELYQSEDYQGAVVKFQEAVAGDNRSPEYYTNLGMAYIGLKDYESAHKNFDYAVSVDDNYKYAYRGKGIAYLKAGDYEAAIGAFNTALAHTDAKVTTVEYDVLKYRAEAEVLSGKYEDALETYTILLEVEKEKSDDYYLRGCVYARMGDSDKAKADFDAAIKLKPGNYQLYWNIYDALVQNGMPDEGKNYLNAALVIQDDAPSAHKYRGMIQFLLGEYSSAVAELNQIKDSADVDTLLYLGMAYEAQGDSDSAYAVYTTALSLEGANARVYNQLGLYRIRQNDYAGAIDYFQKGIALEDPVVSKDLKFNEAAAYEKMGDFATALAKFEAYAAEFGSEEAVDREIQFLKSR